MAARAEDPARSRLRPARRLSLLRAPIAGMLIDARFDGEPLHVAEPAPLTAPLDQWPQDGEICKVPWGELERRFGG